MMNEFELAVETALSKIGKEKLDYFPEDMDSYHQLYAYVEKRIYEHELYNSAIALKVVRALHKGVIRTHKVEDPYMTQLLTAHCLSVCKLLMDLKAPLSKEEEDIAVASCLCHETLSYVSFARGGKELVEDYGLDERILSIVTLLTRGRNLTNAEKPGFFHQVETDKLALLVRLSDRGNIVEQLYNMSVWSAHEYIYETRTYYFPMCIYAKEAYPELASVISLIMEKMRCLIEATEILVSRYEKREMDLTNEILTLKEENARIRRIIKDLKKE